MACNTSPTPNYLRHRLPRIWGSIYLLPARRVRPRSHSLSLYLDRALCTLSGKISQEDDDGGHVVGGTTVECLADQPLSDHVGRFGGVAAAVDDARVVEHLEGGTPARPGLRAAPWRGSMAASHGPSGHCAALQPGGRACASGKGAPSHEWPALPLPGRRVWPCCRTSHSPSEPMMSALSAGVSCSSCTCSG